MQKTVPESVQGKYDKYQLEPYGLKTKMALVLNDIVRQKRRTFVL